MSVTIAPYLPTLRAGRPAGCMRWCVAPNEQAVLPASVRLMRRLVQMALMIGVSHQTTKQILNDLKARDLIRVHRGTLEIVDLAALRDLCL